MIRCLFVLLTCVALSSAAEPDRSPGSWWYTPSLEDLLSDDPKVVVTAILNEPEDQLRKELVRGYFTAIPIEKFETAFNLLGELDDRQMTVQYYFRDILEIFAERDPEMAWKFIWPYFKTACSRHFFNSWNEPMIGPSDREALATMPFWVEHRDLDAFLAGLNKAGLSSDERFEWAKIYFTRWWMSMTPEEFKEMTGSDAPNAAIKAWLLPKEDAIADEPVMDWSLLEKVKSRDEALFSTLFTEESSGHHWAVMRLALRERVRDHPNEVAKAVSEDYCDAETWARCAPKAFFDWLKGKQVDELLNDDGSGTDELLVGFGCLDKRLRSAVFDEWSRRRGLERYDLDLVRYWFEQNPEAALKFVIELDNDYELSEAFRNLMGYCETPSHVNIGRSLILEFGRAGQLHSEGMLVVMEFYGDIDCGEAARFGVDWLLAHRAKFRSKEQLIEVWSGQADPQTESMDGRTFGCLRKWAATEPEKMEAWAKAFDDAEVSAALQWMAKHPQGRMDYNAMGSERLKSEAEWIATLPDSLVKEKLWIDWFLSEPERDERRRKFYEMMKLVEVSHFGPLLVYYAEHCGLQTVDVWQNVMQLWAERDLFAALKFAYAEAPRSVDSIYINGWNEEPMFSPKVLDDGIRSYFWGDWVYRLRTFLERGDDPSVPVKLRSFGEAFSVWCYNLWWNFQIDPYREYEEPEMPKMPKYSIWPRRLERPGGKDSRIDEIWKSQDPDFLMEVDKLFELSAENLFDMLADKLEKKEEAPLDLIEVILGRFPESAETVEFILTRYGDDQKNLDWQFGELLEGSISGYGRKATAVALGEYVLKRGREKTFYRDHVSDFLEELESYDVGLAARIGAESLLREHGDDPSEVLKGWAGGESDTNSDDSLGDRTFGCLRKWAVVDPDAMEEWIDSIDDEKTRQALRWLHQHPCYWTAEKLK